MRRDGGEGESRGGSGGGGAGLPSGSIQEGKLQHPASEDELLPAVAGGAVPPGSRQD